MLADALDGTLSAADQELFDSHMAFCGPCSELLADARRGAAWLEMLRHPQPEPPAALLERILAQTSGAQALPIPQMQHAGYPGAAAAQPSDFGGAALTPGMPGATAYTNVLPFRLRVAAAVRRNPFGQIVFQPRLAMTAAMAFFSIALTLDLTGVRVQDLKASDLRPSSLKRQFYSANARVVQYYEGLRVVYELESRVHDLQSASDNDAAPVGVQSTPQNAAPSSQPDSQPRDKAPAAKPGQTGPSNQSPAAKPEQKQRPTGPNAGTSRRESPGRPLSLASVVGPGRQLIDLIDSITASSSYLGVEGRLV
jgi:Putative zinc-finger